MCLRFAAPLLAAAFLFLAGCGQAVIKPPVALDQSLLPATLYVPDCPLDDEGFLGFIGSADRAMGESACRAMPLALATKSQGMNGEVNFVSYKADLKAPKPVDPDTAAEASLHSRYRVILSPARSSRVYEDYISYVAANQTFSVLDTATGTVVGRGSVKASPGGMPGAMDAAATLLAGLRGNRCEVLNGLSVRAAFHTLNAPKCTTFTLYPFHPDDEADEAPPATAAKPN